MPVFLNQSLQYDYTGYIPVAGTAHMGMDLAGHCRALLKIQPTMISDTQAAAFLETEDGLAPRPIWRTPSWFAQNATVVWMVRTDFLRMHVYATFTQDNPMTEPSQESAMMPTESLAMNTVSPDLELLHLIQGQHGALERN